MKAERGVALLATLWLLVAISAVAFEVGLSFRMQRLAAANLFESARSRAAAMGCLESARARLDRYVRPEDSPMRIRVTGGRRPSAPATVIVDSLERAGIGCTLEVRDVGGSLHINRATEEELRRLFRALRMDFGKADRIAQAIADWRDPDREHRPRGAERAWYVREGRPMLPRDGPFRSLDELTFVRGVEREDYERARPHLTLMGTGRINVNAASREVLLALEGMTEEAVSVVLRHRRQGEHLGDLGELADQLSPPSRRTLEAHLPHLLARTTFQSTEFVAGGEGWVRGSPVRVQYEALLARAGDRALLVWARAR